MSINVFFSFGQNKNQIKGIRKWKIMQSNVTNNVEKSGLQ